MKILEWMLLSVSVTPVLAFGQAGGEQTNLRLVSLTILCILASWVSRSRTTKNPTRASGG